MTFTGQHYCKVYAEYLYTVNSVLSSALLITYFLPVESNLLRYSLHFFWITPATSPEIVAT